MNLTSKHLAYWRERKARPSWWRSALEGGFAARTGQPAIRIDEIVNANTGEPIKRDPLMGMYLFRLARKNGDLIGCLQSCTGPTGQSQNPKRAAHCRRWLKRLGLPYCPAPAPVGREPKAGA